jgi:tetrahydrodipicolinate N-succinyltransferase
MGLRDSPYVGWVWESHAEWMVHQMTPDNIGCSSMLVNSPHLYYGSTRNRYCNWQFWEYIKDQHGYQAINTMWMQAKRQDDKAHKVESPLGVLARNMKWETSDLNDAFGDWAMRNVTWDYSNGAVYREKYGSYANKKGDRRNRVSILNTVDARDGEYVIPSYRAPQRYGYNLVRLEIDTDNRFQRIRVRFRGLVQSEPEVRRFKQNFEKEPETVPDPASDWRWGIVGVLKNGSPYYSPLQRGKSADLAFNIRRNTEAVWLVVTATPSEYHSIEWDQIYYSIYRYPWMVQIDGARPAPKNEGKAYSRKNGKRHANGGGWVASGAEVDRSAYVGPEAMVLGSAKVLGDARIEDRAVVSGQAVVSDQAIIREDAFIGGKSIVNGKALVEDEATVYAGSVSENAQVGALTILEGEGTKITGNARVYAVMNAIRDKEISGDAHLIGDIELHTTLSQGVFYGIITPEMSQDPRWGSERKAPEREVTKPFSSNWDNAER